MGALIGLFIFIAVIAGIVWSCKREMRMDREKREREKAAEEAWLAEEKLKPKARLKVIILDDIELWSEDIEPKYERYYGKYFRYTSEQVAESLASEIAKGGVFRKGMQFWPHQVIEKVTVKLPPFVIITDEEE